MKQIIIAIFSTVFFVSCTDKKKEYFDDGNLSKEFSVINNKFEGEYKEYYPNQKLKKVSLYKNGVLIDSIVEYYNNTKNSIRSVEYILKNDSIKKVSYSVDEKKTEEGFCCKNKKVGIWISFHKNGFISKRIEYLNIAGKEYANQGWYYDDKGNILSDIGNYMKLETPTDTVAIGEPVKFLATLSKPLFSYDSEVSICIARKTTNDFKKDFSNINEILLDTFPSLKNLKKEKAYDQYNLQVLFGLRFSNKGEYNLRGFLIETNPNYENSGVNNQKYDMLERKIYFEKKIYVR